jgi:hypothetical protein
MRRRRVAGGGFKGKTEASGTLGRTASGDHGELGAAGSEGRKKGEEPALTGRTQWSEREKRWKRGDRAGAGEVDRGSAHAEERNEGRGAGPLG